MKHFSEWKDGQILYPLCVYFKQLSWTLYNNASFEISTAVKNAHPEERGSIDFEMLVTYRNATRCHKPEDLYAQKT
jgi:hypothetical protein